MAIQGLIRITDSELYISSDFLKVATQEEIQQLYEICQGVKERIKKKP